MDLDLAPAIESFIEEAADFVVQLEEDIMALEETPDDQELINAAFRAAHTIKGSGGLFGFDKLVKFTHVFESVLMRMRDGSLVLNKEISEVMLAGVDHLGQMLQYIDVEGEHIPEELTEAGDQLGMMLEMFLDAPAADAPAASEVVAEPAPEPAVPVTAANSQNNCWHLSLRFGENVLRDGMDPSSFLRYLQRLGEIQFLKTLSGDLPAVEEIDSERNYLGFEIRLASESSSEDILDVFEFVQEQSQITLLAPNAGLDEYRNLITTLPEADELIGDILVECGSLQSDELQQCLSGEVAPAAAVSIPTGSDAQVALQKVGNDQVLVIAESMTIYRAEAIADQLNFAVTNYEEPISALNVDLTAVEEIDTTGVQILVSLQKTLAASGANIAQVTHGDASRALFDLYRLQLTAAA